MEAECGYSGKILKVDLSSQKLTEVPTSLYAERFIGGRGMAAKIYWDEVSPSVKPFDPDNRLIITTGPLTGIPGLAASRWAICAKSPITTPETFCYSSLGGRWGVYLRFSVLTEYRFKKENRTNLCISFFMMELPKLRDAGLLWVKKPPQFIRLSRMSWVIQSGLLPMVPPGITRCLLPLCCLMMTRLVAEDWLL